MIFVLVNWRCQSTCLQDAALGPAEAFRTNLDLILAPAFARPDDVATTHCRQQAGVTVAGNRSTPSPSELEIPGGAIDSPKGAVISDERDVRRDDYYRRPG